MRTERTPAVYLLDCIPLIVTQDLVHFPAQWHHQIPPPMTVRPSGSRYGSLTSKGLDIFSAFSSMESTMVYSCSSQSVVESDELSECLGACCVRGQTVEGEGGQTR